MDKRSRLAPSPPSIRVCDVNPYSLPITTSTTTPLAAAAAAALPVRLPSRRSSRQPSDHRSPSSPSSYGTPMPIPQSTHAPLAPPPLPPPRYIEDLAHGHDSGWKWGNSFEGKPTLAPIKASSSLFGGSAHARPSLLRRDESFSFAGAAAAADDFAQPAAAPAAAGR
ncbi:hypothetical protein LOY97_006798, partial [Ophidiomyces ophidiicola]